MRINHKLNDTHTRVDVTKKMSFPTIIKMMTSLYDQLFLFFFVLFDIPLASFNQKRDPFDGFKTMSVKEKWFLVKLPKIPYLEPHKTYVIHFLRPRQTFLMTSVISKTRHLLTSYFAMNDP
jgi:hypothetical protein